METDDKDTIIPRFRVHKREGAWKETDRGRKGKATKKEGQ